MNSQLIEGTPRSRIALRMPSSTPMASSAQPAVRMNSRRSSHLPGMAMPPPFQPRSGERNRRHDDQQHEGQPHYRRPMLGIAIGDVGLSAAQLAGEGLAGMDQWLEREGI